MPRTEIRIKTKAGICDATIVRPEGQGPWPAVIVYPDAFGVRPAILDMAERLAARGYYVFLPNMFYRHTGFAPPPNVEELFADTEKVNAWFAKYVGSLTTTMMRDDAEAFLDQLAREERVTQPHVGVVGYCMGGRYALITAGSFPDRVVACASYHGGNLATDRPESAHLTAARIKGEVYIGAAIDDPTFPPAMRERLEASLVEARVHHRIETYEGCRHGWTISDTPAFNPGGSEKHFETLFTLLEGALKTVRVVRRYKSAPEKIYDAWLDPAKAKVWMAPQGSGKIVRATIDAREGGAFSLVALRDGQEVEHTGEYLELVRPRRLVFTFEVPSLSPEISTLKIDFIEIDGGTELVLHHEGVLPEYVSRTAAGWSKILDMFESSLGL
ncbi:MAG: alpha/beta fold hydrolase [Sandaracinaceae bacterium]|nr:alpha/beta fold hydrolase [Sandaracinaceae bacterium]